jgi:hypothetical protein
MSKPRIFTVPNKGDTIPLDCGYGCHEHWEACTILSVFSATRLFDLGADLCASVREPSGAVFTTTLVAGN